LYQFLQPAIGGRGQFLKVSCHHGVSIVLPWKGSSEIRLQWTQKGRRFPRARGNKMVIGPRRGSRFRPLEPIKNNKGQEEKNLRWNSRK
jgi:hypothetical protein